jgi:hypothetical protein
VALLPPWLLQLIQAPPPHQEPAATQRGGQPFVDGRRNVDLASVAGLLRRLGAVSEDLERYLLALNGVFPEPVPEEEVRRIAHNISQYPSSGAKTLGLETYTAAELAAMTFQEPVWVIPTILPVGLAILAGNPKIGKSWLALGWGLAVAAGGRVFGGIEVERAEVLYAALEDRQLRMQERIKTLLGPEDRAPDRLIITHTLPRVHEGLAEMLAHWLRQHPQARLVIIDTLVRIKPPHKAGSDVYAADSAFGAALQRLALDHQVAIVLVHHLRKMAAEDPIAEVSGSTGLTGTADTVLVLKRSRAQSAATLLVTGRDVDERELALRLDEGQWVPLEEADEYPLSAERQEILRVVPRHEPGKSPMEVAKVLGKQPNTIKQRMWRMAKDGQLKATGEGTYTHNLSNSHNRGNPDNPITGLPVTDAPVVDNPSKWSSDQHNPAAGYSVTAVMPQAQIAADMGGQGMTTPSLHTDTDRVLTLEDLHQIPVEDQAHRAA